MAQFSRPQTDVFNSGWTAVPAPGPQETNPLSDRLNDNPNSDSTYVVSSASPQGDTFQVKLAGVAWPNLNDPTPVTLTVRLFDTAATSSSSSSSGAPAPATVVLLQGNLVLAYWTLSPPSSFLSYTFTLGPSVLQQITNYADLRVQVTAGGTQDGCCNTLPAVVHLTVSGPYTGGSGRGCGCWPASVSIPLAWNPQTRSWFGLVFACDEGVGFTSYTLQCLSAGPPVKYTMTVKTDFGGVVTYTSLSATCGTSLAIVFASNGQTSQPYPFTVSPNCMAANAQVTV